MTFVQLSCFFCCLFFCFACNQGDKSHAETPVFTDTLDAPTNTSNKIDTVGVENGLFEDSITVLEDAIKLVFANGTNSFDTSYQSPLVTDYTVLVNVRWGHTLTKTRSHLIVRRESPIATSFNIYTMNGSSFKEILSEELDPLTYVNDTTFDVNGDGILDFVINGYGATGCCLKAFSNVFLQKNNNSRFSKKFWFINPTFSPREAVIRGICYGHMGDTEMYKFRWNKNAVDTLEFVSFEKDLQGKKTGKIIVSKSRFDDTEKQIIKRLNSVPAEYTRIEGYYWFQGN